MVVNMVMAMARLKKNGGSFNSEFYKKISLSYLSKFNLVISKLFQYKLNLYLK
ncbi:hypothetical protein B0O79_0414 [Flavobacteriaceae bacterium MAR_2009_75]|nr:hypothetical protein B0O79_0414 [Flavobacteriaceae bacterium MAR_2009_75]